MFSTGLETLAGVIVPLPPPLFCVFWTLECLSFSGFPAALILDEITKFFNLWKGNRHLDLEYTYARLGK